MADELTEYIDSRIAALGKKEIRDKYEKLAEFLNEMKAMQDEDRDLIFPEDDGNNYYVSYTPDLGGWVVNGE